MFGGVQVHSLQTLSIIPNIGSMLGTGHSRSVLEQLQAESGGQVIFGQESDPIADRYRNLQNIINTQLLEADMAIRKTSDAIFNDQSYSRVESVDDLYTVSAAMQDVIVTHPTVRDLLNEGRIYGYGIDPKTLPKEDTYGRLINNGVATSIEPEKELVWEWASTDPKLTDEDLDNVKFTREWLDEFLYEQMKPGGDMIDPTDPSNTISKKKH